MFGFDFVICEWKFKSCNHYFSCFFRKCVGLTGTITPELSGPWSNAIEVVLIIQAEGNKVSFHFGKTASSKLANLTFYT